MALNKYKVDIDELMAENDVPGLVDALEHEDFIVRKEATRALKYVGDRRAEDALIKSLEYEDWHSKFSVLSTVRANAAEALGKMESRKAVDALIFCLKDPDIEVRWKAAEALGRIGDDEALEPLIDALNDSDGDVRKHSAKALGELDNIEAIDALIPALEDIDWPVRKNAATALGKIGDERALKPLLKSLKDDDIDVRRHSIAALVKMKNHAVKPLLEKLYDPDWQTRAIAAEALGRIGSKKALKPLIKALSNNKMRDDNRYVRGKAAEALGRIGDKRAVKYLEAALEEHYIFVRKRAQEALDLIELTPELNHFENDEFYFDFPQIWDIEEIYKLEKLVIGYWPGKTLKFSINRKSNAEDLTVKEFADIIVEVFHEQHNEKIFQSEDNVAGSRAIRIVGDNYQANPSQRTVVTVFKKYDDLYYFWFKGNRGDMEDSSKYKRIMMNSFQIK
ncbi:MAG TPA: HEAT repeat domain-containing protein [Methanobacteriaceae archaeon]|nr:HEAT repeat domain-containing protein [Methanobacteriaceae archaeon]